MAAGPARRRPRAGPARSGGPDRARRRLHDRAVRLPALLEWLDRKAEADELFDRAERLADEAVAEVIETADVVCATNSTTGSELLDGHAFDTLVVDEATQSTEPSCLIPVTRAGRVIMAGDHRQLPPTVQSEAAAERGLRETLFERLAQSYAGSLDDLAVGAGTDGAAGVALPGHPVR